MDRRQFIESSIGAGLILATGACAETDARDVESGATTTDPSREIAWGLQLYTVRSLMSEDVDRTLATVGAFGYREVEFAGYFDRAPEQIRTSLESAGLTAPATHLGIEEFRTRLERNIDVAATVGHQYLVLPFLESKDRGGIEVYERIADEMNVWGERCRSAGLRFAYHNHDFELESMNGTVPLEVLIERTEPDLVSYEVDLFWLIHGGGDPLDYFARYPGRFDLCHVKDRTRGGDMVDVGEGVIDFAEIFRHNEEAGLQHFFVEHDNPADPADSVRASVTHLKSLSI